MDYSLHFHILFLRLRLWQPHYQTCTSSRSLMSLGCMFQVARDVASGLKYLHEEKKLLHGDLKSGNILIKGDFKVAKLCDFGVALKLDDKVGNVLQYD